MDTLSKQRMFGPKGDDTIGTCNEIMEIIKGSSKPISSEHIKLFFTHLVKNELRIYAAWVVYQCLKTGLDNPRNGSWRRQLNAIS